MRNIHARRVRAVAMPAAAAVLATAALAFGAVSTKAPAHADGLTVTLQWQRMVSDGSPILMGGAGIGDLDGQGPSVIVGDRSGYVYAYHTSDGSTVAGWPYKADASIHSTPAVSGSGTGARVYIGVGSSAALHAGGILKLSNAGAKVWEEHPFILPGNRGGTAGLMSSVAVGPLQTSLDVVGGAMGLQQYAFNGSTGKTLPGFPWLQADTNFSSPALAPLGGKTTDHIIEGGDSTKGVADYYQYQNGGHIRILAPTGNLGQRYENGGLACQYNTTQVVQSSPAVGNFLDNGVTVGIVVGTGTFWPGASDTNKIIAINTSCQLKWKTTLDGNTLNSPALADVDGLPSTGPDVVVLSSVGTLYVLNGTTGAVRWSIPFGGGAEGSPTTFKDPNGNYQDIVVPTGAGAYLVNGLTHAYTKLTSIHAFSTAAEDIDPDGRIGISIVGYGAGSVGEVQHFTVDCSYATPATIETSGSWPMFHRDPQLDGWAGDLPFTPPPPLRKEVYPGPTYHQPASAQRLI